MVQRRGANASEARTMVVAPIFLILLYRGLLSLEHVFVGHSVIWACGVMAERKKEGLKEGGF